jgi:hypothetical protein
MPPCRDCNHQPASCSIHGKFAYVPARRQSPLAATCRVEYSWKDTVADHGTTIQQGCFPYNQIIPTKGFWRYSTTQVRAAKWRHQLRFVAQLLCHAADRQGDILSFMLRTCLLVAEQEP